MKIDVSFLPALAAAFLLTFARIGTLVMLMPAIGEQGLPSRVRLAVALVLTAVLVPAHEKAYTVDLTAIGPVLVVAVQEIIIGAVLGLIQVMQHLDKIDEVGKGIAVAFVATIYGVGAANLVFLPAAGKLRIRIREEQVIREMTLEGVISILEGMNPRMLETKLLGFLAEAKSAGPSPPKGMGASG